MWFKTKKLAQIKTTIPSYLKDDNKYIIMHTKGLKKE